MKVVVLELDLSGLGAVDLAVLVGCSAVQHLLDTLELCLCSVPCVDLDTWGQPLRHKVATPVKQGMASVLVYQILCDIERQLFNVIDRSNVHKAILP